MTDPGTITETQFKRLAQRLLRELDFTTVPPIPTNDSIRESVVQHAREIAQAQNLNVNRMVAFASDGAALALICFPNHDPGLQEILAKFCFYFCAVDDMVSDLIAPLKSFSRNIVLGKPHGVPILDAWTANLQTLYQYFGYHGADSVLSSTCEYLTETVFEFETANTLQVHRAATKFPHYLRMRTGLAAGGIAMICPEREFPESRCLPLFNQAMPDLMEFICFINDVFSFYKECIVGEERGNYVYVYARANGIHVEQALEDLAERTVGCVRNTRDILASEPEMLRYVEDYIRGNIVSNVCLPRYRLAELGLLGYSNVYDS
ncbi:isoprenoid synthase domain-containing protein [Aspergillus unguis]